MTSGGDRQEGALAVSSQGTGMWRPAPIAIMLGGLYLVFCSIYIWISGNLAAQHAGTVDELARIEAVKGLIFVLVCAGLITALAWWLLAKLSRSQNQLARNKHALLLTERRAMAGSLASSIAHDMNNILTVGCASAEMLVHSKGLDAEQAELARDINDSFNRMVDMTRRLSAMGRTGTRGDLQPGDLRQVLEDEINFARHHVRLRGCQIDLKASEPINIRLHVPMLQQMLVNLLLNAADAMKGQGNIEVQLRKDKFAAVVEVHDSGPGIPAEEREHVFEPFYTTKPEGNGLGLLSVKAAAQMHRGRVVVIESPLGGACFRVSIPLESPAA